MKQLDHIQSARTLPKPWWHGKGSKYTFCERDLCQCTGTHLVIHRPSDYGPWLLVPSLRAAVSCDFAPDNEQWKSKTLFWQAEQSVMSLPVVAGSALVLTGPARVDGSCVNILHIGYKYCATNCAWHLELCCATWMCSAGQNTFIHSA